MYHVFYRVKYSTSSQTLPQSHCLINQSSKPPSQQTSSIASHLARLHPNNSIAIHHPTPCFSPRAPTSSLPSWPRVLIIAALTPTATLSHRVPGTMSRVSILSGGAERQAIQLLRTAPIA